MKLELPDADRPHVVVCVRDDGRRVIWQMYRTAAPACDAAAALRRVGMVNVMVEAAESCTALQYGQHEGTSP